MNIGRLSATKLAVDVLAILLLNVRLVDFSIRDETCDEIVKLLELVRERLRIVSDFAFKNSKVLFSIKILFYF